jgi:hypothetical protein
MSSPPEQPLPRLTRINRLLAGAWKKGVLPEPSLDPEELERLALGKGHEADLGGDAWRAPLHLLCRDLREEAALNPIGRTIAHGQITKVLRERARAYALWSRCPQILERPVRAPVIVLGPMRSGTTRIQRLLACDPRFAHTRLFETLSPVPPRRRPDLRAPCTAAGLAFLRRLNPALSAVHPTGARRPEEEFGLFTFSFGSAQLEAQWHVPRFARWWEDADTLPMYDEFRRLLQTLAWQRGDAPGKTWLLKAPQFTQDPESLIATFPDARLLCLDRDPDEVVASSASLVWQQMRLYSDSANRQRIGREWLRKTMMRRQRTERARKAWPNLPQLDVSFAAVNEDWRAEIRRIYAFLDMALPGDIERRMAAYVEKEREHLAHRYAAQDFGLLPQRLAH